MIRKAFLMEVQAGKAAEYEKTHNPIWPELHAVLKRHGLHNYSIFHDAKTDQLFGYVEIEDEARLNQLADNEVCKRWWLRMKQYLVADDPAASKAREREMREVFHME
jgi:L-rhamnose mutarotase